MNASTAPLPPAVAQVRAEICARCALPCESYRLKKIRHADARERCPQGVWGAYGRAPASGFLGGGFRHRNGDRPAASAPPAEPATGFPTKARRAWRELRAWKRAGAPVVPRAVYRERLAHCRACEYYAASGNLGLGECRAPGCGCTRAKLWLATATCPHPAGAKWAGCRG